MSNEVEHLRTQMVRRAIVMQVGGFRPPDDPMSSWFGRVAFGLPSESWPQSGGKPMLPLCQLNLTELPFRPPRMDDLDFVAVFLAQDVLPDDQPNGEGWCLRAYPDIRALRPLEAPTVFERPRAFPMRPQVVDSDYPCWEDVAVELSEDVADRYDELFENASGLKLGGWPTLVQSEIFWAPWNEHPAVPEYVFQIDSEPKAGWAWADGGVGYFGRGTATGHEDTWTMAWQCY